MLLKKTQYFEITIRTIEREYNDISFKELNQLCVNSYIQYKSDDTNEDRVYECVAPDELQENLNLWTKDVCIHGTYDSWVYHGPNVIVCRICVAFADAEYRKQLLYYDDKMIGKGNTMH